MILKVENIVYNELLIRGYNVDVGIVEVYAKNDEGKTLSLIHISEPTRH